MLNHVLTRRDAARILHGYYERDSYDDDFAREIRDHFGFSGADEDDRGADFDVIDPALEEAMKEPPVADLEVLLAGLEVDSLEQLRAFVEAGRRIYARGPVLAI